MKNGERLRIGVALVIVVLWSAAVIAAITSPEYAGLVGIVTPVVMTALGFLFGSALARQWKRNGA